MCLVCPHSLFFANGRQDHGGGRPFPGAAGGNRGGEGAPKRHPEEAAGRPRARRAGGCLLALQPVHLPVTRDVCNVRVPRACAGWKRVALCVPVPVCASAPVRRVAVPVSACACRLIGAVLADVVPAPPYRDLVRRRTCKKSAMRRRWRPDGAAKRPRTRQVTLQPQPRPQVLRRALRICGVEMLPSSPLVIALPFLVVSPQSLWLAAGRGRAAGLGGDQAADGGGCGHRGRKAEANVRPRTPAARAPVCTRANFHCCACARRAGGACGGGDGRVGSGCVLRRRCPRYRSHRCEEQLSVLREATLKYKGDNGIMKKKFTSLNKTVDDQRVRVCACTHSLRGWLL